jgi:hypothetical protein
MSFVSSVLTTVKAPHREKLDARALVHCLTHPEAAKAAAGRMSAFFGEVAPDLQKAFAGKFDISEATLIAAAKTFGEYSGESYTLAVSNARFYRRWCSPVA